MNNITFTPSPKVMITRDLQYIKTRVGGTAGTLNAGGVKTTDVLKVAENVYVTSEVPRAAVTVMLAANQADIHTIRGNADTTRFIARFKNFRRD